MQNRIQFIQLGDWLLDCEQQRIQKDNNWQDVPSLTFKLLMALVEEPNRVISNDQLIKTVWGDKQVVSDENLQQRIRMLRKLLSNQSAQLEYIGTVRGKGYRLLVMPSLVKSKVKISPYIGFKKHIKSIVLLSLLFTFITLTFVYYKQIVKTDNKYKVTLNRIAVMPFIQKGVLRDFEGLDTEVTFQVIESLGALSGVEVASFNEVQEYNDIDYDVMELGNKLDVAFLITGEIEYKHDQFYVSYSLLDTLKNTTVLDENLKIPFEEILELPQLIIETLANRFNNQYQPKIIVKRSKDRAYRLYLKGQQHYLKYNKVDNQVAEEFYRKSLAISPAFPLALCGLSNVLSQKVHQYDGDASMAKEALRLANSAISLQSDLAQAYKAKGFALDINEQDEQAIKAYQQALNLDPNNIGALLNKAILHWEAANYISAYILIKKVIKLDPLDFFGYLLKAQILAGANDFDRAEPIFDKLISHHPKSMIIAQGRAQFYFDKGDYGLAVEESKQLLKMTPGYTSSQLLLADSLLFSGQWLEASNYYKELSKLASSWEADYAKLRVNLIKSNRAGESFDAVKLYDKALNENEQKNNINTLLLANYLIDKNDLAIKILKNLIEQDRVNLSWLEHDPHLKHLRKHKQFKRLKEKLVNNKLTNRKKLLNNDGLYF